MTCDLVLTHRTFWACDAIRFHEIKVIISEFPAEGFITVRSRHFGRGGNFPMMVWSLSPAPLLSHPRGFPEPRALSCGACFLCHPPFPPPPTSYPLDPLFHSCTRCPRGFSPQLRNTLLCEIPAHRGSAPIPACWTAALHLSSSPASDSETPESRGMACLLWICHSGRPPPPPCPTACNASTSGLFLIFSVIRWTLRKETPTY